MPIFHGAWRVTVVSVDALWPQRVVIHADGRPDTVVPGRKGASIRVNLPSWELVPQHEYGGIWRENVRSLTERTRISGVERTLIRTKDHDWPKDRSERNLVVSVERAVGELSQSLESSTGETSPARQTTHESARRADRATVMARATAMARATGVAAAPTTASLSLESDVPPLPDVVSEALRTSNRESEGFVEPRATM